MGGGVSRPANAFARTRTGRWTVWKYNWLANHKIIAALERARPHARGMLLDVGCGSRPFAWVLEGRIERYLGVGLEKGHSADDWSTRPLPHDWLVYAALDVELLIPLRAALVTVLADEGKTVWAEQEFEAARIAPPPPPRTDPWRRTSGIHSVRSRRQLASIRPHSGPTWICCGLSWPPSSRRPLTRTATPPPCFPSGSRPSMPRRLSRAI